MGIFGPTSPYHWAPLNGLAATVQTKTTVPCQPCHRPVCTMNDHRCMRDIPASDVVATAARVAAYRPLIDAATKGTSIDPNLLEGIVFLESAGYPDALAGPDASRSQRRSGSFSDP